MKYNIVEIEEFNIIGLSVKTKNKDGKAREDIKTLFGNLIKEDVIDAIPGKLTYEIFCIYTDYESGDKGEFLAVVGCKTESLNDIPEGFIGRKIEKSLYRHYKIEDSNPDKVAKLWQEISASNTDRKYTTDFEVYGENADINIYISVKWFSGIRKFGLCSIGTSFIFIDNAREI